MKRKLFLLISLCLLVSAGNAFAQKIRLGKICGNPNLKCRAGDVAFEPFEIQFEMPKNAVISSSEPFYAVILDSKASSAKNCKSYFGEPKRLEAQSLFPNNKVFVLKCDEYNTIYYTGVAQNVGFMAVYAGKTLAEAKVFLKKVQTTGKFKGANIRKLQAEFNGT